VSHYFRSFRRNNKRLNLRILHLFGFVLTVFVVLAVFALTEDGCVAVGFPELFLCRGGGANVPHGGSLLVPVEASVAGKAGGRRARTQD
jgi:hypothetical protein